MFGFGMPELIIVAVILGIVALLVVSRKGSNQQTYDNLTCATKFVSQAGRPIGKSRNAGAIIFFTVITLGIYYFVWYYKINDEIVQHDPNQNVSPGLAVCALFIPFINLVSFYNTANRIKLMQKADGATDFISPGAALAWIILFGIGYPIYVQAALNNHWHEHANRSKNDVASAKVVEIPKQAVVAES